MSTDPFLIDSLRSLRGQSLRKLAKDAGIDASSLSYWLRGIESRVSEERLKPAKALLGLGEDGLLPGVHRWIVPSHLRADVLQTESIVQKFLPGGGTIYPVRRENRILNKMTTETYVPWSPWIRWILVPLAFPNIRIILKMGEKVKQLLNPFDNHSPDPSRMEGWFWPDGSKGNEKEEIKKTLWVDLPEEIFLRISGDENLSVLDLEAILGIAGNLQWTWERLIPALKAKGITPDEIARNHGLL